MSTLGWHFIFARQEDGTVLLQHLISSRLSTHLKHLRSLKTRSYSTVLLSMRHWEPSRHRGPWSTQTRTCGVWYTGRGRCEGSLSVGSLNLRCEITDLVGVSYLGRNYVLPPTNTSLKVLGTWVSYQIFTRHTRPHSLLWESGRLGNDTTPIRRRSSI